MANTVSYNGVVDRLEIVDDVKKAYYEQTDEQLKALDFPPMQHGNNFVYIGDNTYYNNNNEFVPNLQDVNRRFISRDENIIKDEIAGRDATGLCPVSVFGGNGSVIIPKLINEHLFPFTNNEYKLFAKRVNNELKIEGVGNFFDVDVYDLGDVLAFDSAIEATVTIVFAGDIGNITRWCWGDGTYTDIVQDGGDITISHTYSPGTGVYYMFSDEVNYNKLYITIGRPAIKGDLSSVSALTYYLRLYNCSQVTGDLSSVSALTYYLDLYNCSQVTGDLSSVSALTYYLSLTNCSQVTGDLSSVSALTYLLSLYNCSQVTINADITLNISKGYFSSCDFSQIELERLCLALDSNGKLNGVLEIHGVNVIPNAQTLIYINNLTTKGWVITHN